MKRLPLLALAVGLLVPRPAAARVMQQEAAPPAPTSAIDVSGPALVERARIHVRCTTETQGTSATADCQTTIHFRLRAAGPGSTSISADRFLQAPEREGGQSAVSITFDGAAPGGRMLGPGEAVRVDVRAPGRLSARFDPDTPMMTSPMHLRHMVLGDTRWGTPRGGGQQLELIRGEDVRFEGAVEVDARDSGAVTVQVGSREVDMLERIEVDHPSVTLGLAAPRSSDPIQNGGPALMLGAIALPSLIEDQDNTRFSLGVAYEIGFTDWLFASVGFETDFESIYESLVIEAATPWLFLLPSLGVGVGVVARQLGLRDADAAARVRMSLGFPVVTFVADMDYWPDTDDWTVAMRIRASL